MNTAVIALIVSAGCAIGADPKPADPKPKTETPSGELRRLDSVTWDLKTHTLSWVIVKGTEEKGEFVPSGSQHYQVTPDDATMGAGADQRTIREDEAAVLHRLLDTLSIYCARSVVWWENGEDPDTQATPATPPSGGTPTLKPERPSKQDETEPKAKPEPPRPVKVGVLAALRHLDK